MLTVQELLISMNSWRWWPESKRHSNRSCSTTNTRSTPFANSLSKNAKTKRHCSIRSELHQNRKIPIFSAWPPITSSMRCSSWRHSRIAPFGIQSELSINNHPKRAGSPEYFSSNVHHHHHLYQQLPGNAEFQKATANSTLLVNENLSVLLNHVLLFISIRFPFSFWGEKRSFSLSSSLFY